MLARLRFFGVVLWGAGALFACGGGERAQPVDAGGDDGGEEHEHPADPEDDVVVTCPDSIPDFEPGMTVAGDSASGTNAARISARLVSASPVAPRKFENSWVVELIDAEGEPIEDVEVKPDEPWMDVHRHGGGYKPNVIVRDEPGQVQLDRINLKMSGPWRLNLNVSSARVGDDVIEINVCVP